MSNNINFLEEIEKIRKKRKITIEELCAGVISPRSYYRHMQEVNSMKFNTLETLMKRLNVSLFELIILTYSQKRSKDPGTLSLVYNIYRNRLDLIKDLIPKFDGYRDDNPLINRFIDMHLYKYNYLRKEISLNSYTKLLMKILSDAYKIEDVNVYKIFIMIECYRIKTTMIDDMKLYKYVLEHDFCMNPIYSFIMLSMYLRTILSKDFSSKDILTLEQKEAIFNKYLDISKYYSAMKPLVEMNLYHAYICKYKNNKFGERYYLVKYINGLVSSSCGPGIDAEFEMIREEFGIDYIELLEEVKDKIFNLAGSPFNLI